jgi:MarR family transcriptional regulator, organic hydroperoxide resistance regulator
MVPRVDELDDVLQFMRELWAVVHALQRTSKSMEQRAGVTGPQRLVLRVVGLFPGISAGPLAGLLHVHPSTLTGILHRLGTQGLLTREASPGDRRRAVLRLTVAGKRVNARRAGTVEAAVVRLLRKLGAGERAATERALRLLAAELGGTTDLVHASNRHRPRNGKGPGRSTAAGNRP